MGGEAYAGAVARLVGINHVVLEVDDLEKALEFYGRLFELEFRGRLRGMAFLDMGDQFLVLSEGRSQPPDGARHFGLVVEDRAEVRRRLEEAQVEILRGPGLDFRDPWGNHVQVVQYSDVQFTKTPAVLRGMGLDGLGKSESALRELREKGLD
jgi:catechol 2,3-dioxygenase-like lactoylglutathione lyase family enzyme